MIFIDSDVILDVALRREPFFQYSHLVLSAAENGVINACTSANCIANIHYILRSKSSNVASKQFLESLIKFVQIVTITHEDVITALTGDFKDFEDGLQHACAVSHHCTCIVTRNTSDYQTAILPVHTPDQLLIQPKSIDNK